MRRPENLTRSAMGPSDVALVVAARAGEGWAREALFRRHAPMANRLAFRLMGRDDDVDDLVQESFAQALGSLGRLEQPAAFAPWLAGIVVRTGHKVLRRRRLLTRLGLRSAEPIDLDRLVGATTPPDRVLELRALWARIAELPPVLRVALVLRHVEELPLAEIAEMTRASLATVKRRIAEAVRRLGVEPKESLSR